MKKFLAVLASAVLVFTLTSCSGTGESAVDPGYPTSTGAPEEPGWDDGSGGEGVNGGDGEIADRAVVETAFVTLESESLSQTADETKAAVSAAGGYLDSWQQQANDAGELWRVYATVRLPAARLDAVLGQFSDLGQVKSLERSTTDVTTQVIDLDARIAALESSVQRLLDLIASANTTSDLLEAENYLSQRQAELESLKGQREYLQSAISYATVSLSIFQTGAAAQHEPRNFWEGIVAGWNGLIAFLGGSLVVLGVISPWLLLVAPFALVGLILWRRSKAGRQPKA